VRSMARALGTVAPPLVGPLEKIRADTGQDQWQADTTGPGR
jgi:hypothetical protein